MIKVNLKSGKTVSFDLKDEKERDAWKLHSSSVKFQNDISGIGIIWNSHWYTLPLPKKFRNVEFEAELVENHKKNAPAERKYIGERIKCYADDTLISLLVYYGNRPKMSRVDISRVGKRRHSPDRQMK